MSSGRSRPVNSNLNVQANAAQNGYAVGNSKILKMYGNRIGPKLKERLTEIENCGISAHDVECEIILMRDMHNDVVGVYSVALEAQDNPNLSIEQKQKILLEAMSLTRTSTKELVDTVEKSAKISALFAEKMSPDYLHGVVKTFVTLIYRIFDDGSESARAKIAELEAVLDEELGLPSLEAVGRDFFDKRITRDAMGAMDETIPAPPEMVSTEGVLQ